MSIDAPSVDMGTFNTCSAITVGHNDCASSKVLGTAVTLGDSASMVTIPGNFIVNGTTTQVNTEQTTIKDNTLVLNQSPLIQGRDSGLVLRRHALDVASGTEDSTLVLSAGVGSGATSVPVVSHSIAKNWVLKFSEGAFSDVVSVSEVSVNSLTCTPALVNSYTLAATVKAFKTQSNSVHYNESSDEWRFGYSLDDGSGAQVVTSKYANVHCQKVIVEEGFSSASMSTATVNVADNAGSGAGVEVPGLKLRGSYQLILESTEEDGATATFFISKGNSAQMTASVFAMTSSFGASDESIWVEWPVGSPPKIFHDVPRTGASGLAVPYKVFYNTVGV